MPHQLFLLPLALYLPAFAAMALGGLWVWAVPAFAFGLVPLAELLLPGTEDNRTEAEEQEALSERAFDLVLYAAVPLQILLLLTFLGRVSMGDLSAAESVGMLLTMGIASGTYGINVAHELGHRRSPMEQRLAQILLATTLYMHFFVEHNRGHHRRVATQEDPASSRRGETVYAFWLRSITGGWRSAWQLENSRLERQGSPWWSWDNQVLRFHVIQGGLLLVVATVFGPVALGAWILTSIGGWLTLETVNYLEHYGLRRQRKAHGGYERVCPTHSWNTNRPLGRLLLFDVTRHSDHHANPTRPYPVLRHHHHAPQLPYGYPMLMVLALVPPLFHAVMDPALQDWETRQRLAA